jgi:hypothetical protein
MLLAIAVALTGAVFGYLGATSPNGRLNGFPYQPNLVFGGIAALWGDPGCSDGAAWRHSRRGPYVAASLADVRRFADRNYVPVSGPTSDFTGVFEGFAPALGA